MTEFITLLGPDELRTALREDVARGLSAAPKHLPPKYFYDARGSKLFDEITRLPEYYPTRTERSILMSHAADIATACAAQTLVELGSGTSEKTRLLLDALTNLGTLRTFIPFDVDPSVLREARDLLSKEYPDLAVHPVVGDFEKHLAHLPADGIRLVAFLGSTIGNLGPEQRHRFLSALARVMQPGDHLLLGADLVKPVERLVAAYDDAEGVTAEFNRNVLTVVNRELGADFDVDSFEHVVTWNADESQIEMRLRATRPMTVTVRDLELVVHFDTQEEILTETCAKFSLEALAAELASAGFTLTTFWCDQHDDFAVALAAKAATTSG